MLFEQVDAPLQRVWENGLGRVIQVLAYVLEYPRVAECGSTYHDGIHSVLSEALEGSLGRCDVSVPDNGNVHVRVVFDFSNHVPIGFSAIHLGSCSPVNSQFTDAAVLQCFGKIQNEGLPRLVPPCVGGGLEVGSVPTQPCFDGNGQVYGIDYGLSDCKHFRDIAQQPCTGTFAVPQFVL